MKLLMCEMLNGMKEIAVEKAGKESLEKILQETGANYSIFQCPEEASTKTILVLLERICNKIHMNLYDTAEVFGEYWIQCRLSGMLSLKGIRINNSKSLLTRLNELYFAMATSNKDHPVFGYEWKGKDTLMLSCVGTDERQNLSYYFFKGMVNGVAKFYKENLQIFIGPLNNIVIIFPNARIKRRKARQAGRSN